MFDGKARDSCQGIEGAERSYLTIERLRRLSLAARESRISEASFTYISCVWGDPASSWACCCPIRYNSTKGRSPFTLKSVPKAGRSQSASRC
ncbi:hypothetical protein AVEN_253585-1 [Araneus ventricosus]|uniref:Uncharacterized protein n=1 Tax=Araneus ventricosus TaxID=182803 RepID=A0A4Y2CAX3_ARAVE|nr:hypothetical protein AVEN_253585-1 [Araneus ventricosus]